MLNVADHGLGCDVGQLAGLGEAEHVACWFTSSKAAMVSGTGKDGARTHPGRVTQFKVGRRPAAAMEPSRVGRKLWQPAITFGVS